MCVVCIVFLTGSPAIAVSVLSCRGRPAFPYLRQQHCQHAGYEQHYVHSIPGFIRTASARQCTERGMPSQFSNDPSTAAYLSCQAGQDLSAVCSQAAVCAERQAGPPCSSGKQTQIDSNAKQAFILSVGCVALQSECSLAHWCESGGIVVCVCPLHVFALPLIPQTCAVRCSNAPVWSFLQDLGVVAGLCMPGQYGGLAG